MGKVTDKRYGVEKAGEYLEQLGYTDVTPGGQTIWFPGVKGCDKSDAVMYRFDATTPNGTEGESMIVCKGLFKGATARQG